MVQRRAETLSDSPSGEGIEGQGQGSILERVRQGQAQGVVLQAHVGEHGAEELVRSRLDGKSPVHERRGQTISDRRSVRALFCEQM
jgi:hypothetical protein